MNKLVTCDKLTTNRVHMYTTATYKQSKKSFKDNQKKLLGKFV